MFKPKKPKTHFEQVPLEIVKKIAKVEPPIENPDENGTPVDPPAKKQQVFPVVEPTTRINLLRTE